MPEKAGSDTSDIYDPAPHLADCPSLIHHWNIFMLWLVIVMTLCYDICSGKLCIITIMLLLITYYVNVKINY